MCDEECLDDGRRRTSGWPGAALETNRNATYAARCWQAGRIALPSPSLSGLCCSISSNGAKASPRRSLGGGTASSPNIGAEAVLPLPRSRREPHDHWTALKCYLRCTVCRRLPQSWSHRNKVAFFSPPSTHITASQVSL
ncbi:hypothetical protein AB1N83_004194 [Pleurotus pulmonarius]